MLKGFALLGAFVYQTGDGHQLHRFNKVMPDAVCQSRVSFQGFLLKHSAAKNRSEAFRTCMQAG